MPDETKWEKIGVIAVNSGLCIVADPCVLVHSRHTYKDFGEDWGTFLERFTEQWEINPKHDEWMEKVKAGKRPEGPMPAMQRLSRPFRHQLKYSNGNEGLAVVTNTAAGDGIFNVHALRGENGQVLQIKVDFETIPEEYR